MTIPVHVYRVERVGALLGVVVFADGVRAGWAMLPQIDERRARNLAAVATLACRLSGCGGPPRAVCRVPR